jgi:choline/glycine/proline betaine transport protein
MTAIDKVKQHIHPVVFPVSAAVILGFVIFGTVFSSTDADGNAVGLAPEALLAVRTWITDNLGWFFIAAVATFIIFLLFLVVSRYGRIRLGPDDSRPDYSYLTWFAMLFSAGMGIGLVFWGVAEPIYHFVDAPRFEGGSEAARTRRDGADLPPLGARRLVRLRGARAVPGLLRLPARPADDDPLGAVPADREPDRGLGRQPRRHPGHLRDHVRDRDLARARGGADQRRAELGLRRADRSRCPGAADRRHHDRRDVSVVSGLDKGIRRLSEINITLAGLLLAFVAIAGPTVLLLGAYVENLGNYLANFVELMFWAGSYSEADAGWLSAWTVFYWAWWISWAPFVGMFIARISRGRTIREFILGVLLVPSWCPSCGSR